MDPSPIVILYGTRGDPIPETGSVIVLPGIQPAQEPPVGPGQMELPL